MAAFGGKSNRPNDDRNHDRNERDRTGENSVRKHNESSYFLSRPGLQRPGMFQLRDLYRPHSSDRPENHDPDGYDLPPGGFHAFPTERRNEQSDPLAERLEPLKTRGGDRAGRLRFFPNPDFQR